MASHIDNIIKMMGYTESSCIRYKHDGFDIPSFSVHTVKVLEELSPYAVYIVDDEPFVVFFEELSNQDLKKQLHKKIWNAQIPVAIVCGASTVRIYNGCTITREDSFLTEVSCIPINEIDEHSPFSYWEITSQDFWSDYIKQFSGVRLNEQLLRNLSDLTEKLKNKYNVFFATKLVLRLIFIRYLIDRGVDLDYEGFSSNVKDSQNALLGLLKDKKNLYGLFAHLKNKFNGNLFELDNEINDKTLSREVFDLLFDFLSANIDTKTGQYSFFDLYDFNIIPVELISNIYEILLGKEKQNKDNAFYTPRYLADYILDGSVTPFVRIHGKCKVLDPSCGSGIFLVESYRRIVEEELNGQFFTEDNNLLQNLLVENIYGIDLNEDAIDVAIFSLYLAVLDYKNPKTLKQFTLPNLKGNNLFVCDFFNEDELFSLEAIPFDFIVGNPPWDNHKGLHVTYCENKGRDYKQYLQCNDTCRSFILRSKDFCTATTQCCFVLHSKMLYMQKGPSKAFRKFLLTKTELMRIVELSSVRTLVFKNADAPAVIISYRFSAEDALNNHFEYISMKPNIFFKLFNIIVVEKNDIKFVQQKMLYDNDWAWKTIVYGLTGDIDVIAEIQKTFPTIKQVLKKQTTKLHIGTGVQYNDGDKKDATHLTGKPFLDSEAIDHFSIDLRQMALFEKTKIHRPRNPKLFEAPYCLVRRGLDMGNYTMRAVYSEVSFVFREASYAIKGTLEQRNLLLNITGLLNSNIYAYFNLMLNSSLGIEREQRQTEEILSFPFVYSDKISQLVERIQDAKKTDHELLALPKDTSHDLDKLNHIIQDAFNLSENEFVDYALNIQIPQLTGVDDQNIYRDVEFKDFEEYGKYFYDYLSDIFARTNKYIKILVYPKVAKYYNIFEVVVQEFPSEQWIQVNDDVNDRKIALTRLSSHKINDWFYCLKDVLFFEEHSFFIIKPNYYKNWHPAIAKLDLMEVTDQILSRDGGNK